TMEGWGEDEQPFEVRADTTWEAYRDAARIQVGGKTGYRVEWDLGFETEEALHEYYDLQTNGSVEKAHVFVQFSSDHVLKRNPISVLHIRYCVSTSFPNYASTVADVANAAASWKAVANVNFDYVPSADSNCVPENLDVDLAVISNMWWGGGC